MNTRIRAFVEQDIPEVAALRRVVFQRQRWETQAELERYLETVFFRNPWRETEMGGTVYLSKEGAIVGFIGVVERPARIGNRTVRYANSSQFMVHPEHRGGVGVSMMRDLFARPYDAVIADAATDVATRMWLGMGGSAAPLTALGWTRPLSAGRVLRDRVRSGVVRATLTPLSGALDRGVARLRPRFRLPASAPPARPLDTARAAAAMPRMLGPKGLQPVYDGASLAWMIERLHEKPGQAHSFMVCNEQDELLGWCAFVLRHGNATVYELVAGTEHYQAVLDRALLEAHAAGATVLSGRYDVRIGPALIQRGARLEPRGSGALIYTHDPELMSAALDGRALLAGLEGEWWMSF